jgi:hypothetical protein
MTEFQTLRPGLLVNMFTKVDGNVTYHNIDRDVKRLDLTEVTDIHTRKQVSDVEEQERATKARTKIRGLILSVCVSTAFSNMLLCPDDTVEVKDADGNVSEVKREQLLLEAIAEGRRLAEEFNATARTTRIAFYCITGRIAQNDVETVRAITGEIRQLMDDMQQGLKALDVKAIRDAANKATETGKLLTPEAGSRLDTAIKASREAARKIAKAGEQAAKQVDRQALAKVKMARNSFLDIDVEPRTVAKPKMNGRNIDLAV